MRSGLLVIGLIGLLVLGGAAPVLATPPPPRPDATGVPEPPERAGGIRGLVGPTGPVGHSDVVRISRDLGPGSATAVNDDTVVAGHTNGEPWVWEDGERLSLETLGGAAWPAAIDAVGDAVGSAETPDGYRRAVRWRGGVIEQLEGLGGEAAATAVNGHGTVAGWADDPEGRRRAVRWEGDTVTALPDLGEGSAAYGLNDRGDVVGSVRIPGTNRPRAALWSGDALVDLEQFAEAHWSEARGVGENGHVVGILELLDGCCYDGFYLDDPQAVPVPLQWGYYAVPLAVDREGRAVGYGADEIVGSHAYAYIDGRTLLLEGYGGAGAAAYDLNERGTVAGFADIWEEDRDERRAVLWELPQDSDPDPDPPGVPFTCEGLPASPFTDVAGNTHRDAIDCVYHWGIARGASAAEYRPAVPVTRGQMATFVAQSLDLLAAPVQVLPPHAGGARFLDVPPDSPHAASITRLAEAGIVRGRTETRYDPHAPVTRAQTASLLVGAYEYATGRTPADDGQRFSDVAGNTHERAINQLAELGVAGGYRDGTYRPGVDVRRDHMAAFLSRLLEAMDLVVHDPAR